MEQIKFDEDKCFEDKGLFTQNDLEVDAVFSLLVHEHLMRSFS